MSDVNIIAIIIVNNVYINFRDKDGKEALLFFSKVLGKLFCAN